MGLAFVLASSLRVFQMFVERRIVLRQMLCFLSMNLVVLMPVFCTVFLLEIPLVLRMLTILLLFVVISLGFSRGKFLQLFYSVVLTKTSERWEVSGLYRERAQDPEYVIQYTVKQHTPYVDN